MSILVTKPGALNDRDRNILRRKGIVCIEARDPGSVKLLTDEGATLGGNDLLLAAMQAIAKDKYNNNTKETFANLVAQFVAEARS